MGIAMGRARGKRGNRVRMRTSASRNPRARRMDEGRGDGVILYDYDTTMLYDTTRRPSPARFAQVIASSAVATRIDATPTPRWLTSTAVEARHASPSLPEQGDLGQKCLEWQIRAGRYMHFRYLGSGGDTALRPRHSRAALNTSSESSRELAPNMLIR